MRLTFLLLFFTLISLFSQTKQSIPKIDTIVFNDYLVTINPIDSSIFYKYSKSIESITFPSFVSGFKEVLNEYSYRTNDSTLIIKLLSKKELVIKDQTASGLGESTIKYVDYIDNIKSHLLISQGFERWSYFLVHNITGEKTTITDHSQLSMNNQRTRIIAYSYDDFAYKSGGFSIYDITTGKLNQIIDYEQIKPIDEKYYWTLSNVYWKNSNEIIFLLKVFDIDKQKIIKEEYSSLQIKKR